MEPEIRYTTTADGVSIAYYTMGDGHPLVVTSSVVWSHLRFQPFREYHRSRNGHGLGRGLQVVRSDARGTGLSDRHSLDFSMNSRMLDHLQRFYGVHEQPTDYDLVLNTQVIGIEASAEIVVRAAAH